MIYNFEYRLQLAMASNNYSNPLWNIGPILHRCSDLLKNEFASILLCNCVYLTTPNYSSYESYVAHMLKNNDVQFKPSLN